MVKTTKVAAPKGTQAVSKEVKQFVASMIEKALKPCHKQFADLQEKLKALKMAQGSAPKAKPAAKKSKAPAKVKTKKTKTKNLKAKA